MQSYFYIESIEPLDANDFYDLFQLDFICTLYQVEKDSRSNVCFFECTLLRLPGTLDAKIHEKQISFGSVH